MTCGLKISLQYSISLNQNPKGIITESFSHFYQWAMSMFLSHIFVNCNYCSLYCGTCCCVNCWYCCCSGGAGIWNAYGCVSVYATVVAVFGMDIWGNSWWCPPWGPPTTSTCKQCSIQIRVVDPGPIFFFFYNFLWPQAWSLNPEGGRIENI
jgi:hypothetical protein